VVVAATTVAGAAAIPLLAQYAEHESLSVRAQLAWAWERFDTREYGDQVIARLTYGDGLRFIAKSREQLEYLAEIGGRPSVECSGSFSEAELRLLPPAPLEALRLHENDQGVGLSWLADCPGLRELRLINCTGPVDLAALPGLTLDHLVLASCTDLRSPEALARSAGVRSLAYFSSRPGELTLPPSLEELSVSGPVNLLGLDTCSALSSAHFDDDAFTEELWEQLRQLPELTVLELTDDPQWPLVWGQPLASVRKLVVHGLWSGEPLNGLAAAFPSLERLDLLTVPDESTISLEPLRNLRGCEVYLNDRSLTVIP